MFQLFFFASGFCALVYEMAWVRIFSVEFGNTVYAVSTVLTIFMAGQALGAFLFGRWIDRGRHPVLVYGGIELALGLYAFAFVVMLPPWHELSAWLLHESIVPHSLTGPVKFLLAGVVLLPPATLMGGTLPVLAKYLTRSPETIGLSVGKLYALNTLGAVAGCLGEAYLLVLWIGIKGSILLAATINVALAAGCGILLRWASPPPADSPPNEQFVGCVKRTSAPRGGRISRALLPASSKRVGASTHPTAAKSLMPRRRERLLLEIAFGSGFFTLGTEVLWTRLFANFFSGNVIIFATILGAFLSGIALGSFLVSRWADRLGCLERAMGVVLLASGFWLVMSVFSQGLLGHVFRYLRTVSWGSSSSTGVDLCLATMFLVVAVPAVVFGAVFPLLFRWSGRLLATLGEDVGRLYAANTLGAIAGSFVAGFLLIRLVGVNGSLLLLAAGYAGLSSLAFRSKGPRRVAGILACVCLALAALPSVRRPIYWINGGFSYLVRVDPEETRFLEEGVEGTVGVAEQAGVLRLTVNGLIVAESTHRDLWDLFLKAHLPMLLHEDPRQVALVGLGAGVSLGAVEAYDVDQIDCIELSSEVVAAHRLFAPYNGRCWEDPRLNLVIHDGRHFLRTTDHRYDVISVDPVDPPVCNLYTQDFFQLCHDRLETDGLMVQWVPLFRLGSQHVRVITRAFMNVFEETTLWYDGTSVLLIGKRDGRLEIDVERFVERAGQSRVQESLRLIGTPSPRLLMSTFVAGPDALETMTGPNVPENTDDFPYLEYAILRAGRLDGRATAANLEMLAAHYQPIHTRLRTDNLPAESIEELRKTQTLMRRLLAARVPQETGDLAEAGRQLARIAEEFELDGTDLKFLQPFIPRLDEMGPVASGRESR